MEYTNPFANAEAYKYAFGSAMREHLNIIKEQTRLQDLLNRGQDDSMKDEEMEAAVSRQADDNSKVSIETKDMLYHLESVIEFVVGDLLKYHVKNDVEQSKHWGFPLKALTNNFGVFLLGPQTSKVVVPPKLSTSGLLDVASSKGKYDRKYSVDREDELGKLFYKVLRNAFEYHVKFIWNPTDPQEEIIMLSSFVAAYLKRSTSLYPQVFSHREYLVDRVNHVIKELENYSHVNTDDVPLEDLFKGFELMLRNHLELSTSQLISFSDLNSIVKKLREQGNNLMSNNAYPQAIKIYTEAVNLCMGDVSSHLPQLLVNRAIAFIGLTCFPEAIDDLNLALKHDISFTPAWIQLAYAQLYMGNSLLALKCYSVAFKCCTGVVLPYNFPPDESYLEEYKVHKIRFTLPQFIEQTLKSVNLTEIRAKQQRQSGSEIRQAVSVIKESLEILKQDALDDDKHCFMYPPSAAEPSAFRQLAERTHQTRPSMFNHEVSQGIIAGADAAAENVGGSGAGNGGERLRPPMIALGTRLGTPRPDPANVPNENRLDDLLPQAHMGHMEHTNDNRNNERNNNDNINNTNNTNNNTLGDTIRNQPPNVMRDVLRGLLPEGMSDGISNIITHSFGAAGGNGEFVISSPPTVTRSFQPNGEGSGSNNTQQSGRSGRNDDRDHEDEVPLPDLD